MRGLFTARVAIPLITITAVQSLLTMGAYSLPVIIPVAAEDLGIDPESVGFLVATVYVTAMTLGLGSSWLLGRLGPTRVFQMLLFLVGAGAMLLLAGHVVAAVACAVVIGLSAGPMNPAGSVVLARVAKADIRALVFSLKQCGTPLGGMLAGAILPPLMLAYGWTAAVLTIPVAAFVLIVLVPFGRLGTAISDNLSTSPLADARRAMVSTLSDASIRAVTLAGFGLAACQMGLATYLVVYLWREVGYTPEQAGLVFATLHVSGIVARIVFGLAADRLVTARTVLVAVGLVLGMVLAAISTISTAWSLAGVYAVIIMAGASGNAWVGIYFAEVVRLSPAGKIAEITAGSQFVTYLGIVCGPLIFGGLLQITNNYALCFNLFALISIGSAIYLAFAPSSRR